VTATAPVNSTEAVAVAEKALAELEAEGPLYGATPVGARGDLLKKLLDLVLKFLPLIL